MVAAGMCKLNSTKNKCFVFSGNLISHVCVYVMFIFYLNIFTINMHVCMYDSNLLVSTSKPHVVMYVYLCQFSVSTVLE